jgi:hypothetical protein
MVHRQKVPEWLKRRAFYVIYWKKGEDKPLIFQKAFFEKGQAEKAEQEIRKDPSTKGTLLESNVLTYKEIYGYK